MDAQKLKSFNLYMQKENADVKNMNVLSPPDNCKIKILLLWLETESIDFKILSCTRRPCLRYRQPGRKLWDGVLRPGLLAILRCC